MTIAEAKRAYRARKFRGRVECEICRQAGITVRFLDTLGGQRMMAMHQASWHP